MSQASPTVTDVNPPEIEPATLFSRPFVALLGIQFLFGLSYSSFLLLPKFLRLELHATATEIGQVSGAATVVAAMVAPFSGYLGQRFSRRGILTMALVAEGVAAFGFCFADEVGPFVFALRALQGAAWVSVFNVTATWAADLVPGSRLAQAIGYLGSAMLVTNALAPGVAEPLAERFGYAQVFGGAGCIVLLAFGVVSLLQETRTAPAVVSATQLAGHNAVLRAPRVMATYYGSFLLGAGIGAMFTYVQPYALDKGARAVGEFFFGYVAAAIFVRLTLAKMADRVGPVNVAVFAFSIYAITVAATAVLEPSWLAICGISLGTSHGLAYPALTAAGFAAVGPILRTRFMGWYTFGFNFGFALTVLTLGPVVDAYGYPVLFTTVGLLIGTGAITLWTTRRSKVSTAAVTSS
jgi:predicted MFS family arabinose efflux permease